MKGDVTQPVLVFRHAYEHLLSRLLSRQAHREVNARTGVGIRAIEPTSFAIDLSTGQLPVCGVRKTYPKSAAAEVAWFLTGSKNVTFIRQYAPLWDKFVEDDGETVAGAYGFRWRRQFGRDQIQDAVQTLRDDPTNRRVYVSAWDPAEDGLGRPSKNVPCPLGFTLSILDGKLNSVLAIRSSDVFVGLPYDVMGHAFLMAAFASSLGVGLGTMHVTLAHPHLYEVHVDQALEALGGQTGDDTMGLPSWSIHDIDTNPHAYVHDVMTEAGRTNAGRGPAYHCKPEVVA